MTIGQYLDNIARRYAQGNATEHTFRGDLQQLIESLVPDIRATNEAYVFEIAFIAAPMLLGFDIMSKMAQNIFIVAWLDEEQAKAEALSWQQSDWEDED